MYMFSVIVAVLANAKHAMRLILSQYIYKIREPQLQSRDILKKMNMCFLVIKGKRCNRPTAMGNQFVVVIVV